MNMNERKEIQSQCWLEIRIMSIFSFASEVLLFPTPILSYILSILFFYEKTSKDCYYIIIGYKTKLMDLFPFFSSKFELLLLDTVQKRGERGVSNIDLVLYLFLPLNFLCGPIKGQQHYRLTTNLPMPIITTWCFDQLNGYRAIRAYVHYIFAIFHIM